jgi:hypothetical protein
MKKECELPRTLILAFIASDDCESWQECLEHDLLNQSRLLQVLLLLLEQVMQVLTLPTGRLLHYLLLVLPPVLLHVEQKLC